jgi:hypothetical protein
MKRLSRFVAWIAQIGAVRATGNAQQAIQEWREAHATIDARCARIAANADRAGEPGPRRAA